MTKPQERRFNMVQSVIRFCDQQPDIVSANKPFQKYLAQLKRLHVEIEATASAQDQNATGTQRAKDLAHARLCLEASIASGQIAAWAADQENGELEARNEWTQSELEQLSAARLDRVCRSILADGRATLAADPDCGLNEAGLRQFEALIGSFSELKEAPRNKTSERSSHTKNMALLMKGLTELLRDKLDKAALSYKKTHPGFYIQYKENRKILDVGVRSAGDTNAG